MFALIIIVPLDMVHYIRVIRGYIIRKTVFCIIGNSWGQIHVDLCHFFMNLPKKMPCSTGPEVIKLFMLSSAETRIFPAHKC